MQQRVIQVIGPILLGLTGWLGCFTTTLEASELRFTPIVRAVQKAAPAVVNIHSEKTLTSPDTRFGHIETSRRVNGMGTGVIIDPRGYIVTNHHVIDGVEKVRVTLADGSSHFASPIAFDEATDLAIIQIEVKESLPVITIGTSDDLMPGEPVIAVGNAYGYEHTVTRGIVSALHRTVQLNETQSYYNLIQTDASINPGNSGGPLLNIDGEMVGINVAVRAGAQGIGFAIPIDQALDVAAELLATHREEGVWHGVVLAPKAERGPLKGLVVGRLDPESPASQAGLEEGDVIVSLDGDPVVRILELEQKTLEMAAGQKIELEVKRGDQEKQLTLELKSLQVSDSVDPVKQVWQMLGLRLDPVDMKSFLERRTRYQGGLAIQDVRPNGPAALQGIRKGDVLVGLHIWATVNLDNVEHILNRPELEQIAPLKFYVVREGKTLYGFLPIEEVELTMHSH
ncbi:Periplasmic serine proteinase Do [Planctomycetales bacterium 10988]|nr:Periplasmic serine proteinase Do [Planctomycetales bacterium 10988]